MLVQLGPNIHRSPRSTGYHQCAWKFEQKADKVSVLNSIHMPHSRSMLINNTIGRREADLQMEIEIIKCFKSLLNNRVSFVKANSFIVLILTYFLSVSGELEKSS